MIKARIANTLSEFLAYWHIRQIRNMPGIDETASFADGVVVKPGVKMGRHTFVNGPGTFIEAAEIGAFCSIGDHVVIGPGEHPMDTVTTHLKWYLDVYGKPWENVKPIPIIGNDVWIGTGAAILRGAVVEDGAVIAAGAVVRGRIPAYSVVGGVPSQVIRYRFDEDIRQMLRDTQWWTWSDEKLREVSPMFNDPTGFLKSVF